MNNCRPFHTGGVGINWTEKTLNPPIYAAIGPEGGFKGFSLKQLADQKGVEMSLTSLTRCVELAVQKKEMGSYSALNKLSTTHRIALTQVKDLKRDSITGTDLKSALVDIQLIVD